MAGNDGSKHSDGENCDLTDVQKSAVDQIRELLDTLPPDRGEVFQGYLKDLTDGEEGGNQSGNDEDGREDNEPRHQSGNARRDSSGD